jgi:hypothetical protein
MAGPQPFGFAGRMKRVAQANEALYAGLIGNHARYPSTKRLSADHQFFGATYLINHFYPGIQQHLFCVG